MALVLNVTSSPVPIDTDGRVLGGGEAVDLNPADPLVAAALADGRCVIDSPPPKPSKTPAAPPEGA